MNHMIFDTAKDAFVASSDWHEYGVGAVQDLGIVPEDKPAWWQAMWKQPVKANYISLTGSYPNQPQPDTAWKIELHREGKWTTLDHGIGGWYDSGRFVWGGAKTKPVQFDGIRVSVFSKDKVTPIKSILFRGSSRTYQIDAAVSRRETRSIIETRF